MSDRYQLIVSMDIEPDREAIFNEVYDTEHIPLIQKLPGVVKVTRLKGQDTKLRMGDDLLDINVGDEPVYTAIYEITSPDVLSSKEWGEAVNAGRWPTEVRPYTTNRRMTLRKVLG